MKTENYFREDVGSHEEKRLSSIVPNQMQTTHTFNTFMHRRLLSCGGARWPTNDAADNILLSHTHKCFITEATRIIRISNCNRGQRMSRWLTYIHIHTI